MTNFVPSNSGLDWFTVQSAAQLPNVAAATIQTDDLFVGARAYVADAGLYICTDATANAAVWVNVASGGGSGAAGVGTVVFGTFGATLAAGQTDNGLDIGGNTDGGIRVARAGFITALITVASAAVTVANITVTVFKNGVATAVTSTYTFGVTTSATATGSVAVAAGDILTVKYTSGAIGNTPILTAQIEVTYS